MQNGNAAPQQPPQARVPSYEEMKKFLDVVVGLTLQFLAQHQTDPFTVHSVATIISKMKFDGTQTRVEIENIISKAATEQLDLIKLQLLRASIDPSLSSTPKASA